MTRTTARRAALAVATAALVAPVATSAQAAVGAAPTASPGWSVSAHLPTGSPSWRGQDLVLSSPGGTSKTVLGRAGRGERVVDVSADGRRVLTVDRRGGDPRVVAHDTAAGTRSTFAVSKLEQVRYLDAAGSKVVVVRGWEETDRVVEVRSPGGTLVRTLHTPRRGTLDAPSVISTPDGSKVVLNRSGRLRSLDARTGATISTLSGRTGYSACAPARWWGTSGLVATCSVTSGSLRGTEQVLRVPFVGTSSRVTTTTGGMGIGWMDAWAHPKGTVALSINGCGPATAHRLTAGQPEIALGVPSDHTEVQTVVGDGLYHLASGASCGGPGTVRLARHDLSTGRNTTVLGGGTVSSVAVVDLYQ